MTIVHGTKTHALETINWLLVYFGAIGHSRDGQRGNVNIAKKNPLLICVVTGRFSSFLYGSGITEIGITLPNKNRLFRRLVCKSRICHLAA